MLMPVEPRMEIDARHEGLVRLLVMWHRHEAAWLPVEGYPRECPSTAGYRPSRQWDSENGAQESEDSSRTVARVGEVLHGLPEPCRAALMILARNRATGCSVWTSARLPQDRDERAQLVAQALMMFGEEL